MSKNVNVGIADLGVMRVSGTLTTYALGSCIGISLFDPDIHLGALLHIMLPECAGMDMSNPYKFADTGIDAMLRKMKAFGGIKNRYICKIAGGARMFELKGTSNLGNIGERNIESVRRIFGREQIRISRQEVGADYARTMILDVETGQVRIRTFGKAEICL